jgi:hypothetical protein
MMNPTELGHTALVGWRQRAADKVAGPVSERTPLGDEQVRALIGGLFFALAVTYVVGTVRRAVSVARG